MRVLAIIATYNEERFIGGCLEHLFAQGVPITLGIMVATDHFRRPAGSPASSPPRPASGGRSPAPAC